jgi:hypothetical protein
MATTIATVTTGGLSLAPEVMEQLNLRPGSKIKIPIEQQNLAPLGPDAARLIEEMMGMFAGTPGPADDLKKERMEEDKRSRW